MWQLSTQKIVSQRHFSLLGFLRGSNQEQLFYKDILDVTLDTDGWVSSTGVTCQGAEGCLAHIATESLGATQLVCTMIWHCMNHYPKNEMLPCTGNVVNWREYTLNLECQHLLEMCEFVLSFLHSAVCVSRLHCLPIFLIYKCRLEIYRLQCLEGLIFSVTCTSQSLLDTHA